MLYVRLEGAHHGHETRTLCDGGVKSGRLFPAGRAARPRGGAATPARIAVWHRRSRIRRHSKLPPDLAKTFTYIDEHIDEHVEALQQWVRQPSISNSGEGIPESAEMVKGFFEELGCESQVYDTGITEYGSPGNPVVTPKCDEGPRRRSPSTGCTTRCR
jgi:hypothetical protein